MKQKGGSGRNHAKSAGPPAGKRPSGAGRRPRAGCAAPAAAPTAQGGPAGARPPPQTEPPRQLWAYPGGPESTGDAALGCGDGARAAGRAVPPEPSPGALAGSPGPGSAAPALLTRREETSRDTGVSPRQPAPPLEPDARDGGNGAVGGTEDAQGSTGAARGEAGAAERNRWVGQRRAKADVSGAVGGAEGAQGRTGGARGARAAQQAATSGWAKGARGRAGAAERAGRRARAPREGTRARHGGRAHRDPAGVAGGARAEGGTGGAAEPGGAGRGATVPGGPRPSPRPPRAARLTVALAVSTSASWLMLDTSGELFMMTRMRDRGSDTSRGSPHLSRPATASAIFAPRPAAAAGPAARQAGGRPGVCGSGVPLPRGSCSVGEARRRGRAAALPGPDYKPRHAARRRAAGGAVLPRPASGLPAGGLRGAGPGAGSRGPACVREAPCRPGDSGRGLAAAGRSAKGSGRGGHGGGLHGIPPAAGRAQPRAVGGLEVVREMRVSREPALAQWVGGPSSVPVWLSGSAFQPCVTAPLLGGGGGTQCG